LTGKVIQIHGVGCSLPLQEIVWRNNVHQNKKRVLGELPNLAILVYIFFSIVFLLRFVTASNSRISIGCNIAILKIKKRENEGFRGPVAARFMEKFIKSHSFPFPSPQHWRTATRKNKLSRTIG
jgi:hypothetical protein